jgi:hypothetical protein
LREYSCTKKVQIQNESTKKLRAKILCKKSERKMLVKLTPELSCIVFLHLTMTERARQIYNIVPTNPFDPQNTFVLFVFTKNWDFL